MADYGGLWRIMADYLPVIIDVVVVAVVVVDATCVVALLLIF